MPTGVVSITSIAVCLLAVETAVAETVRILDRNTDALNARLALIDQASHSVTMAYYSVDDETVSREVFSHLVQAARRGVRVRVIFDACFNYLSGSRMRELMASGIEFRDYHPPRWLHPCRTVYRLHDKLLIADESAVILGGRNLQDRYFGVGESQMFRDRDILVTGQAARHAAEYFDQIWQSQHVKDVPETSPEALCRQLREPLRWKHVRRLGNGMIRCGKAGNALLCRDTHATSTTCTKPIPREVSVAGVAELSTGYVLPPGHVKFLHSSKVATEDPDITEDLLRLINSAQHRIIIETPYLLLTDRLLRGFHEAAHRGVTVQITTNCVENTDGPLAQAGYLTQRRKLLRSGISLWEYQGPHMLHSKSWMVDDIVLIGSYNLDPRADIFDTQSCVVLYSPDVAEALHRVMQNERRAFALPIGFQEIRYTSSIRRCLRSRRAITNSILRGVAPLVWFQL